jgi:HAE1 family hydrophobic/amphiphilic exporter-1
LLSRTALQVQREMRTLSLLANVRPVTPESSPELVIRPRMAAAARLGVTAEDIATIARVATIGDVDANVAKVSAGERRIPVRAVLESEARQDLDALRNLQIPTASGQTTRLEAVADISFEAGPGRIDRFDRERRETIRADLRDGATLGQALDATAKLPTLEALPSGVQQAEYGDAEAFNDCLEASSQRCLPAWGSCSVSWCYCSKASSSRLRSLPRYRFRSAGRSPRCS